MLLKTCLPPLSLRPGNWSPGFSLICLWNAPKRFSSTRLSLWKSMSHVLMCPANQLVKTIIPSAKKSLITKARDRCVMIPPCRVTIPLALLQTTWHVEVSVYFHQPFHTTVPKTSFIFFYPFFPIIEKDDTLRDEGSVSWDFKDVEPSPENWAKPGPAALNPSPHRCIAPHRKQFPSPGQSWRWRSYDSWKSTSLQPSETNIHPYKSMPYKTEQWLWCLLKIYIPTTSYNILQPPETNIHLTRACLTKTEQWLWCLLKIYIPTTTWNQHPSYKSMPYKNRAVSMNWINSTCHHDINQSLKPRLTLGAVRPLCGKLLSVAQAMEQAHPFPERQWQEVGEKVKRYRSNGTNYQY